MDRKQTQGMLRDLGGPVAIAAELSRRADRTITHSALCQWRRVPADWVIHLEAIAAEQGFSYNRHAMRPDVFGGGVGNKRKAA